MTTFEFIGLSRSGHHAIINWFLRNSMGWVDSYKYNITFFLNHKWGHWNDVTEAIEWGLNELNKYSKPNYFSLCYENQEYNFTILNSSNQLTTPYSTLKLNNWDVKKTNRILIIRDFYNCLSSRAKAQGNNNDPHYVYGERFIELWKNHARACINNNIFYIKFEDWVTNKEKRIDFLSKFGCNENYNPSQTPGTFSSFNDSNVLDRYNPDIIPERIKDLIRKDSELNYLIGAIGYNYKNI